VKNLTGKVATITGTASGIGKAIAILLAGEGCSFATAAYVIMAEPGALISFSRQKVVE